MPEAEPRPDPFVQETAPEALEDLRVRLRATRRPDSTEDTGWSLGTVSDCIRELGGRRTPPVRADRDDRLTSRALEVSEWCA
jgi:hypothetical protein